MVDVTPPEESDHSYDSDSETKSEFEESRWYDPTSTKNLEKSEFELLKNVLKIIKVNNLVFGHYIIIITLNNNIIQISYSRIKYFFIFRMAMQRKH